MKYNRDMALLDDDGGGADAFTPLLLSGKAVVARLLSVPIQGPSPIEFKKAFRNT
jgi:hypothetical protein